MAYINRPNKVSVTSFADSQIDYNTTSGAFNQFTNTLQTPLLNVKGIQLLQANFVNPSLQLNDYSQLMFFYYASTTATGINVVGNLDVSDCFLLGMSPHQVLLLTLKTNILQMVLL